MIDRDPSPGYHHPIETTQEFAVELPLFRGPFRLLATLILDQKVDVCDVPMAKITEAFCRQGLQEVRTWSLDEVTWFLAACAALLELKVGRLLPRPPGESEEDLLGAASPDLLYARSLELSAFRQVAPRLAQSMAAASLMMARCAGPPPELAHLYPDVMAKVSAESLAATATRLLAVPRVDLTHVTPIRVSLPDALAAIVRQLAIMPEARFRDLLGDCTERIEVVVRFLALLELYREGKVELSQARMFGDIAISWQGRRDAHVGGQAEDHVHVDERTS